MPTMNTVAVDLRDITLPDARSGDPVTLGELGGVQILTAIRHRF